MILPDNKCDRTVVEVRVGETDLGRRLDCLDVDLGCPAEDECLERRQCAEEHIVRRVSRQTTHPQYNPDNWVR